MKAYKKGRDAEVAVCEFLASRGWSVWRPTKSRFYSRFSSQDIFNVFDLIAGNKRVIRFIQVKSDAGFRKKVEKQILEAPIPEGLGALFCVREYWLVRPDKVKIRRYLFQQDKMVRVEAPQEAREFLSFWEGKNG